MKGALVTMENYQSRPLLKMPMPKPYEQMTDEELNQFIKKQINYNMIIPALIEANERKDKKIADLLRRIEFLEAKALKKSGRKRQTFYLDFRELTDEYLEYLVDNDYMTISEIEKQVGAGKNQLRNRYNKTKRQKKLQKEVNSHDHS